MSTLKTKVQREQLNEFFRNHLHVVEDNYEMAQGGDVSQAYFFECNEGPRVLRINSQTNDGFLKDEYVSDHFARYGIPVPKILEVGEFAPDVYFSVSERMPGKMLSRFTLEELNQILPEIFRTLNAIHSVPLSNEGFGWLELSGQGAFASWKEAVVDMQNDGDAVGNVSFFDPSLYDEIKQEVNRLIEYYPGDRALIHGDFGSSNILSDGQSITGVIDWQALMYGDPLFDVASLNFFQPQLQLATQYKAYMEQTEHSQRLAYFAERIRCYTLLSGMRTIWFQAHTDQEKKYYYFAEQVKKFFDSDYAA